MNTTALLITAAVLALCLLYAWLAPDPPKQTHTQREPVPGEVWVFGSYAGPWPRDDAHKVKIRDVKDGWVRYHMGWMFPDCRAKVESFCRMYQPYEKDA